MGRDDRLALRDHPQRHATRRTSPNYADAAAGPHLPLGGRVPHRRAVLHRRPGTYLFATRDAGALVDPATEEVTPAADGRAPSRPASSKLSDGRLNMPAEEPYMEGHNTWCVNGPGSLLVIPVADLAQHMIAILCFFVQNGYCDLRRRQRRADPGDRAIRRPGRPRGALPAHLRRAVRAHRGHRRAGDLLLRRRADAAGDGARRLDVRRHRPLHVLGASGDPDVPGSASATTRTSAGRCPTRPAWRASSRPSARRTTPTWRRRSRRSPSASSAPAGRSTATPRVPGARAPGAGERPGPRRRVQGAASRSRRSTSSTPSASSRAPCRALHPHLPPGPPPRPGLLRPLLQARRLPRTHAEHMERWHPAD